jgi:hypothetical protein
MVTRNIYVAATIAGLFVTPVAFADSSLDIDPYWKWSKIERPAANDTRSQSTTVQGTGADAVRNPGNYYY